MKKKNRILYLMHIDWHWIRQRPQIIADGLSIEYDVVMVYRFNLNRLNLATTSKNKKYSRIPLIPIPRSVNKIFFLFDKLVNKIIVTFILLIYNPNYIWITNPNMLSYITKNNYNKIIYDCMDDVVEFNARKFLKNELFNLEKIAFANSRIIICTSQHLKDTSLQRYDTNRDVVLIRNGCDESLLNFQKESFQRIDNKINMVYFGTVSEWIDFSLLREIAERNDDIIIHLIGPVNSSIVRQNMDNKNIIFHGPIKHEELIKQCSLYDIFIMPFIVNRLIESVDPVKLYEYISFNKPVISVYYDEISRFEPYVFFYHDKEEAHNVVKSIINNGIIPKATMNDIKNMLMSNTWECRIEQINDTIKSISAYDSQKVL